MELYEIIEIWILTLLLTFIIMATIKRIADCIKK